MFFVCLWACDLHANHQYVGVSPVTGAESDLRTHAGHDQALLAGGAQRLRVKYGEATKLGNNGENLLRLVDDIAEVVNVCMENHLKCCFMGKLTF